MEIRVDNVCTNGVLCMVCAHNKCRGEIQRGTGLVELNGVESTAVEHALEWVYSQHSGHPATMLRGLDCVQRCHLLVAAEVLGLVGLRALCIDLSLEMDGF